MCHRKHFQQRPIIFDKIINKISDNLINDRLLSKQFFFTFITSIDVPCLDLYQNVKNIGQIGKR